MQVLSRTVSSSCIVDVSRHEAARIVICCKGAEEPSQGQRGTRASKACDVQPATKVAHTQPTRWSKLGLELKLKLRPGGPLLARMLCSTARSTHAGEHSSHACFAPQHAALTQASTPRTHALLHSTQHSRRRAWQPQLQQSCPELCSIDEPIPARVKLLHLGVGQRGDDAGGRSGGTSANVRQVQPTAWPTCSQTECHLPASHDCPSQTTIIKYVCLYLCHQRALATLPLLSKPCHPHSPQLPLCKKRARTAACHLLPTHCTPGHSPPTAPTAAAHCHPGPPGARGAPAAPAKPQPPPTCMDRLPLCERQCQTERPERTPSVDTTHDGQF